MSKATSKWRAGIIGIDQPARSRVREMLGALPVRWQALGAVLAIFIASRLGFYAAAFFGSWLVAEAPPIPGREEVNGWLAVAMHWRWDAIHYYNLAVNGYRANEEPAFFPLFPLLIRAVATALGGLRAPSPVPIAVADLWPLVAGILVAHGAALIAFCHLYLLARDETGDDALASRAVLYTAIFPLAFYYAVPYTEALFLATTTGAFLMARRGHWLRAGLWAAAASATRSTGILLAPVLALEIVLAWRRGAFSGAGGRSAWLRAATGLLLAPSGLLLFMLHLRQRLGDPLAFLRAQALWGRDEQVAPWETLWRGLDYALHPEKSPLTGGIANIYGLTVLSTLIVFGFLAVSLLSARWWRPAFTLYGLLLFGLVLSSPLPGWQTMISLGRYVMVFFPVYLTLARWGRWPALHHAIVLTFAPLFGLLTALYVRWYFIS